MAKTLGQVYKEAGLTGIVGQKFLDCNAREQYTLVEARPSRFWFWDTSKATIIYARSSEPVDVSLRSRRNDELLIDVRKTAVPGLSEFAS